VKSGIESHGVNDSGIGCLITLTASYASAAFAVTWGLCRATSHGTQRLAALVARLVFSTAVAARKIVRASSAVNASFSLFLILRGTVTFTAANGLWAIKR
jgi:hypothetical protein